MAQISLCVVSECMSRLCVCLVCVQTLAISYSDKKNKKKNFFSRKLRSAKSKERS